jgi:hypothetical protein
MKVIYRSLFILHALVGIGAMSGGLACIINPQTPLGAPVEMLKNSPFSDFLIPGIILFAVIGLGNVVSALAICFKSKYQGYISSIFTWALAIWIVVQCIMINAVAPPHVISFIIGMLGAILSAIILFKQRQFPANLAINFYNKMRKEI